MTWILYDYVDHKGNNPIKDWTLKLQKSDRARLNDKLLMLITAGSTLPPKLLSGTKFGNIKKLRIQAHIQLRPMLCKRLIGNEKSYTLLVGAIEKDWELEPNDAE